MLGDLGLTISPAGCQETSTLSHRGRGRRRGWWRGPSGSGTHPIKPSHGQAVPAYSTATEMCWERHSWALRNWAALLMPLQPCLRTSPTLLFGPARQPDGGRDREPGRILQLPDVALHGFQALRDRRRRLERRHTRYGNLGAEKELWSHEGGSPWSFQPTQHPGFACREAAAWRRPPLPSCPDPLSLATPSRDSSQAPHQGHFSPSLCLTAFLIWSLH